MFAKATRTFDKAELSALEGEHRAAMWAGDAGLGPVFMRFERTAEVLVIAFLPGCVQTVHAALTRLDNVVNLMHRFDAAPIRHWQAEAFDPAALACAQLAQTRGLGHLPQSDVDVIAAAMHRATAALACAPAVVPEACHTDFYVHTIVLDADAQLYIVDCEDAALGDPMWDLGTLATNLATTKPHAALWSRAVDLLRRYRASDAETARIKSHIELCLGLYAQ